MDLGEVVLRCGCSLLHGEGEHVRGWYWGVFVGLKGRLTYAFRIVVDAGKRLLFERQGLQHG